MSEMDRELEAIRQKKLMELKKILKQREQAKSGEKREDAREILNRFFIGRAWEVFNAAKAQYPQVARYVAVSYTHLTLPTKA